MSTARFPNIREERRGDSLARLEVEDYLRRSRRLSQLYGSGMDHCQFPACLDSPEDGWIGPDGGEIDHIIPWITGGCDHDHNLRVAHKYLCNQWKGDRLSEIQFHCPACQMDALQCWNNYAVQHDKIERVITWRRRNKFNYWLRRPVFRTHDGQDSLW